MGGLAADCKNGPVAAIIYLIAYHDIMFNTQIVIQDYTTFNVKTTLAIWLTDMDFYLEYDF